jgi:alpha-beta hydrolase superfamily lysophospholipase
MLAHGMAEHIGRYARLAEALCGAGYGLYAPDQRGHGRTADEGTLGLFAERDGWNKVVGDLASLNQYIGQQQPGLPIILLGHSMGSYIAQAYLLHHSASLNGAILSGSNFQPVALYGAAKVIARVERLRQGLRGRSALIDFLSFGSFNKAFKPNRTAFDWLSRDPDEVDKYVNDPLCGFRCTNQLWIDLLGGLQQISKASNLVQIDPGLPILVMGGECDPVSEGKRLKSLAHALRDGGCQNLQLNIYPQARHELFNETNRDAVTADVLAWLAQAVNLRRPARCE